MIRPLHIVALLYPLISTASPALLLAQTAEGDILRGKGAFAAGAGWYNLNTAKGNAINVQAMRNYNEEVRLNYINRVQFYTEKKEGKKLSQEEAKKRVLQRMTQLQNNPSSEDIRSGEALNILAVLLTSPNVKQQNWYQHALALPDTASVKDVVFHYFPNKMSDKDLKIEVALSRLSKNVDWPLVFNAESFIDERSDYENAVSRVTDTLIANEFDPSQIGAVDKSLDNLLTEIKKTYANNERGFQARALGFHRELKDASKLFDGPILDYSKEILQETQTYEAKTVGELVAFMLKYRLFFTQADSPRSIDLYGKLFKAMDEQATQLGVKSTSYDIDEIAGMTEERQIDAPAISQMIGQQLIINGGCEGVLVNGRPAGWAILSGNWTQRRDNPAPASGKAYFFAGTSKEGQIVQNVDVRPMTKYIRDAKVTYTFTAKLRSWGGRPPDTAEAFVEFWNDKPESIISSQTTGPVKADHAWIEKSIEGDIPTQTRFIRIRLVSTKRDGENNDGYFDDVSLKIGLKE